MLSTTAFHDIRVRNYEADLTDCRIPMSGVLDPVGGHLTATVTGIDSSARLVTTNAGNHRYDRLVLATGSLVTKPAVPGLREFGFDVDTYDAAVRLDSHLADLAAGPHTAGRDTVVVVVGAGLTGVETACELPHRLSARVGSTGHPRVILVDRNTAVGSDMGPHARPVIEAALAHCGVEVRTGSAVARVAADSVTLGSGEVIAAATVVWCAGLQASGLTAQFEVSRDRLGRLPVDEFLRVDGVDGVFAAGDVAALQVDDGRWSVMSCQHGRPMGRYAGYNVVSDLLGEPMLPLRIPWYVTVLDLGPAGAVYTEGWDRYVVATGAAAKATKTVINTERVYPPGGGSAARLLAAATAQVQQPPGYGARVSGS